MYFEQLYNENNENNFRMKKKRKKKKKKKGSENYEQEKFPNSKLKLLNSKLRGSK